MDYKKLKKDELIVLLEKNEEVVSKAEFYKNEYEAAKKLKDEAVKEAYKSKKEIAKKEEELEEAYKTIPELEELTSKNKDLKKVIEEQRIELERSKVALNAKDSEMKVMQERFKNDYQSIDSAYHNLAKIFEEYIQAFDDEQLFYETMLRNWKQRLVLLKQKVQNFNEQGDKIK